MHKLSLAAFAAMLLLSLSLSPLTLSTAMATEQGPTCTAAAEGKKLSGAAKTSFLGKCERDAAAACEATATERKLNGAARTSFTRKCVKDAVG